MAKGHHRAIIWAIQGDQEFFSNVLKLSHWQNKYPCHECDAQKPMFKKKACPEGKSVKILKEENQQYEYVSPQQAVLAKRSSHPLFSIPGVSTAMVRGDSLHILYSRGVGSHLAGSILHYMCFYDWPQRQRVSPITRLQKIFARVKELYSKRKTTARLTNLRLSMVTNTQKPHKAYPCLEAKAAETKHFLPCLDEVVKESLPEDNPIHHTMLDCLKAFNQISQHFDLLSQPLQSLPLHKTLPNGSLTNMMICMNGPCQSTESCSTLHTSSIQHTTSSEMHSISTSECITALSRSCWL